MSSAASTTGSTVSVTNRAPLWLAIAVTVFLSMPFVLWLETFNFALWCSFIVWAEYFALGAKPAMIPTILVSFSYSAALTGITLFLTPYLSFLPSVAVDGDLMSAGGVSLGVAAMVLSMNWFPILQRGSLPFFNGIAMALAITFSGSFPHIGPAETLPLVAGVWTVLMGCFGIGLGLFTVFAQLPHTDYGA